MIKLFFAKVLRLFKISSFNFRFFEELLNFYLVKNTGIKKALKKNSLRLLNYLFKKLFHHESNSSN